MQSLANKTNVLWRDRACLMLIHSITDDTSRMFLTKAIPDVGLPPSWARRRTAEEHIERFGDLSCAVLWRRKLLLPDHTSRRPAYFGSWRKARSATDHMCTG